MRKKWYDMTTEELEAIEKRHEDRMRRWLVTIGPFLPFLGIYLVFFLSNRGYKPFRNTAHLMFGAFWQAGWIMAIILNVFKPMLDR